MLQFFFPNRFLLYFDIRLSFPPSSSLFLSLTHTNVHFIRCDFDFVSVSATHCQRERDDVVDDNDIRTAVCSQLCMCVCVC